jgi:hypothetical protein
MQNSNQNPNASGKGFSRHVGPHAEAANSVELAIIVRARANLFVLVTPRAIEPFIRCCFEDRSKPFPIEAQKPA